MTPEEIRCFCEAKSATVWVESPSERLHSMPTGIRIGPTIFSWQGDPTPELASFAEVLEKAEKFIIRPKFGDELALTRERFEQILRT